MKKELQDYVWQKCGLPKEFKEEVKYEYNRVATKARKDEYDLGFMHAHEGMFGIHNLTSNAEGDDEMLTVSRKQIDALQGEIFKAIMDAHDADDWQDAAHYILDVMTRSFAALFGSKCLPDEGTDCTPVEVGVAENTTTSNVDSLEPKPSEPKFKEGDIVRYRYSGKLYIVECKTGKYNYALRQPDGDVMIHDVSESDLEPYTKQEVKRHVSVKEACEILGVDESEATKLVKSKPIETCTETCTDDCSSPDHLVVKDEMVDNIIKDGFKNHNRLHIAAMAMAGLLANEGVSCFTDIQDLEHMDFITYHAFEYADKLIKKSEEENDI